MSAAVRGSLTAVAVCGVALVSAAAAVGFSEISAVDLRWSIALLAATAFVLILLIVPFRRQFLWVIFVLSFQFQDPQVRLFYEHAGTQGMLLTLPFMLGLLYLVVFVSTREPLGDAKFKFGGPLAVPATLLLAVSAISLIHSDEHFVGLTNLIVQFQLYLVYLLALNCVRSQKDLEITLKVLFVSLSVQCAAYFVESALDISYISLTDGIVKSAGPFRTRPGGTLGTNPFAFADFVLPIMFIIIATILPNRAPGDRPPWSRVILTGAGMVAIALTLTRTAYVGFFLGVLWISFVGYRRRLVPLRKIIGVFGVATVIGISATPLILERLNHAPLSSSYDERAALMRMAANVIRENPLLGVGPGAYEMTYKRYLTHELEDKWLWMVHNHYLLRTAEIGIFGGLAFVALLLVALWKSVNLISSPNSVTRSLGLGASAAVLATCHQMYWDQWTHVSAQMLFFFIIGLVGAAHSFTVATGVPRTLAGLTVKRRNPPTAETSAGNAQSRI